MYCLIVTIPSQFSYVKIVYFLDKLHLSFKPVISTIVILIFFTYWIPFEEYCIYLFLNFYVWWSWRHEMALLYLSLGINFIHSVTRFNSQRCAWTNLHSWAWALIGWSSTVKYLRWLNFKIIASVVCREQNRPVLKLHEGVEKMQRQRWRNKDI